MKITAFNPDYTTWIAQGTTTLDAATGSNAGFGPDVEGDFGDLSVVGLRQRVSLASNMGDSTLGSVLTTIQTSPWVAQFAVPSNASFGSNATRVSEVASGGAAVVASRSDHIHDGIGQITSSSSNTLQRGTVNLRAGSGAALTATDTDGDGELDTVFVHATGTAGPGGGTLTGMPVNVVPPVFDPGQTTTTSIAGRGYAWSMVVPNTMRLRGLHVRVTATASSAHEWGLFDYSASATSATKLAGGSGTLGSTGWVEIAASGAPVTVNPGCYMLVYKLPASNQGTLRYTTSDSAPDFVKSIDSYVWDDTPDLTAFSTAAAGIIQCFLYGDLNASSQW